MSKVGEAYFDIVGREGPLIGALERSDRAAATTAESISRKLDSVGDHMTALGTKWSVAVTAPITGIGYYFSRAASDAEEIHSKFDQVFKEEADSTRAWADSQGETLRRNATDLEQYLAQFQDIFVPMGFARDEAAELSRQMTQLTVDLASFNNVAEPEVARSLSGALVGNHENARRFGVVITENTLLQKAFQMGLARTKEELTEQDKVLARLELLLQGTADAQGDASRTAYQHANTMRALSSATDRLAESFGERLNPQIDKFINNIAIPVVNRLTETDGVTKDLTLSLTGLAAVAGPALIGLGLLMKVGATGIAGLKEGAAAVKGIAASPAALGLGTLLAAWQLVTGRAQGYADLIEDIEERHGSMEAAFQRAAAMSGQIIQPRPEEPQAEEAPGEAIVRGLTEAEAKALDLRIQMEKVLLPDEQREIAEAFERHLKRLSEGGEELLSWQVYMKDVAEIAERITEETRRATEIEKQQNNMLQKRRRLLLEMAQADVIRARGGEQEGRLFDIAAEHRRQVEEINELLEGTEKAFALEAVSESAQAQRMDVFDQIYRTQQSLIDDTQEQWLKASGQDLEARLFGIDRQYDAQMQMLNDVGLRGMDWQRAADTIWETSHQERLHALDEEGEKRQKMLDQAFQRQTVDPYELNRRLGLQQMFDQAFGEREEGFRLGDWRDPTRGGFRLSRSGFGEGEFGGASGGIGDMSLQRIEGYLATIAATSANQLHLQEERLGVWT